MSCGPVLSKVGDLWNPELPVLIQKIEVVESAEFTKAMTVKCGRVEA